MSTSTTMKPKDSHIKDDIIKSCLAGASSIVACTFVHPIDTIKVRMQIQVPLPDGTKKYPNMIAGIKTIMAEEGVRYGIYKGIEGAYLRESVYSTLRLGLYEPIKRVAGVNKDSGIAYKFMAGGASGLIGSGIANPFDLLKIRMQAHKGEYKPPSWHVNEVYSNFGIVGFWRGVAPTMVRAMLMNGTKLAVYDTIKHKIIDLKILKDGVAVQFIAACVAGFFQTVVTAPMDNIKTRIMN